MRVRQVGAHHAVSADWIGGYRVRGAPVAADGARREEPGFELLRGGLLYQWLKNHWLVAVLEAVAHWLLGLYLAKRRDHQIVQALEVSRPDWMPAHQPGVSQGEGALQGIRDQGNNQPLEGGGGRHRPGIARQRVVAGGG